MPQISSLGFALVLLLTGFAVSDCSDDKAEHAMQMDNDGDCACEALPCRESANRLCAQLTAGDCRDDDASYLASHCTEEERKQLSQRVNMVHWAVGMGG